jgi:hypothetical protein
MAFVTLPGLRTRPALVLPFVGLLLAQSCSNDPEDCAETNDCIDRAGSAGQAGNGGQSGGTAGSGGTRAGSGGQGASGGQGGTGASSGQSGAAGRENGGAGGSAQGGADPGGAGAGGEDSGGMDTGGTDMGGAGMGGAGMGGAGKGGAGMGGAGKGGAGAGGAGAGGAGAGGAGTGGVDNTPPFVVSVSPANGATGVTQDQNIVITFSEAMDQAATEGAYQSSDLVLGGTTRSWSSDGRVLTIDPNNLLFYATGLDPAAVSARVFSLTFSTGARDLAGNQMTQSYNWSFRTLRRITQTLRPVVSTSNPNEYWAFTRVASVPAGASICPTSVRLGSFAMTPFRYMGVFAIQIAPLPAGITDFESATFSAKQVAGVGDPFPLCGPLRAFHVPNVPVNQGIAPQDMPVNTTPLHNLGIFSTSAASVTPMLDALTSLEDDYANRTQRGNMSTYRIELDHDQFSSTSMYMEAYVQLECASIVLTTTYLIP